MTERSLLQIRGGKKSRKKKSKPKADRDEIKKVLSQDPAQALGDAIRDRGDELRSESIVQQIDNSVNSLKWGLGASDYYAAASNAANEQDSGGVELAPAAVIAHYFLKSHGGAHALQSACSLLASVAGLGALLFHKNPILCVTLIKRACLFAMIRHVSGLFAASFLAARAIPEIGLRKARVWIEDLARDPVSQYVFYTACVIFWLPSQSKSAATLWWTAFTPLVPFLLVGPVLLREFVSILLVISDVLVLSALDGKSSLTKTILSMAHSFTNACMSLLVTPSLWRKTDAAQRQALLAKLTSKTSLVLELGVGGLMTMDAAWAVVSFAFSSQRPSFLQVGKQMMCARLYIQFLLSRRKKIERLTNSLRGGASQLPFYVLNVLLDPRSSMGLDERDHISHKEKTERTWRDYVALALELDD